MQQLLKCPVCESTYGDGAPRCASCGMELNTPDSHAIIGETPEEYRQRLEAARKAWSSKVQTMTVAGEPAQTVAKPVPVPVQPAPVQPAPVQKAPVPVQKAPVQPVPVQKAAVPPAPVTASGSATPFPDRLWAFMVGLAGCAFFQFAGGAILSAFPSNPTRPGDSAGTGRFLMLLFFIVPKALRGLVAERTKDNVSIMVWPWLVVTAICLITDQPHETVLKWAYGTAIALGLIGLL